MHVDDDPAIGPLREQPFRVGVEHRIVVGRPGRARLVGPLVVDRRRDVNDLGTGLLDGGVQFFHAGFELREPALVERLIDAAVHAIAGDDEIGPRDTEYAVETLGQVRPRKLSAGMPLLRESRHGLTRQADIDELGRHALRFHPCVHNGNPTAAVGDRVAKHDDPFRLLDERAGGRCRFGTDSPVWKQTEGCGREAGGCHGTHPSRHARYARHGCGSGRPHQARQGRRIRRIRQIFHGTISFGNGTPGAVGAGRLSLVSNVRMSSYSRRSQATISPVSSESRIGKT